jgi:hypothetical protein
MQSMAILVLEITYRGQDANIDDLSITKLIGKLILWLRAMQINDPVAARAYEVLWSILKVSAPTLQAEVNDLLALDGEDVSQAHSVQCPQGIFAEQNTEHWQQTDSFHDPTVDGKTFGPGSFQQQPFDPISVNQCNTHAYSLANQNSTSIPYGNASYVGFSENMPIIATQDIWQDNEIYNSFRADGPRPNHAQNRHEVWDDQETDYPF